ncbi:hypothetical protein P3S68_022730 [Capsicum galapagoense]
MYWRRATADILPECLVQKILSYLSFQEAAQMSILSKTWLQAWLAQANLEFRVHRCNDFETVDKVLVRYRDRKIPIDEFKFWNFSDFNSSQISALIHKWLGIAHQNGVKHLVYRDLSISRSFYEEHKGVDVIRAPAHVVSTEYKGDKVPELKIATDQSNRLNNSKTIPHCSNLILNAEWFSKLRFLLLNSTSWSQVSLYFDRCNKINMKGLQLHHCVPAAQMEHFCGCFAMELSS